MANPITSLTEAGGPLVADGGMGTSLFEMGLQAGGTPELWNVEHPERVEKVHRGFVDAGADVILSNTFGGTRARLDLDRLGDRVAELNAAGAAIARSVAAGAGRPVLVGGSVGPTGQLLEPLGSLSHAEAVELFSEQMEALAADADLIWIETLSSTEELAAAVEAAEPIGLPIVTTMSFDTHGRTMMGVPPADLAAWWRQRSTIPVAIGANCGIGPADVVVAAAEIREADPEVTIVAKANCGLPKLIDGTLWYPTSTDDMSSYAELALAAGAGIIGACCGSVPEHIAQIRRVVDTYEVPAEFDLDEVERRLGPVSRSQASSGRERRRRR
jgi:5-methyltetrahydrofolate--homocysteine methyltransferase